MKKSIVWLRRDLRVVDNHALYRALADSDQVLPVFIFDSTILDKLSDTRDHRVTLIHETLVELNSICAKYGSAVVVRHGDARQLIVELAREYEVDTVYANKDYEPYARVRDESVAADLEAIGVDFCTYKDHVVFEPGEVLKNDGTPYLVYTPFKNKWLGYFTPDMIQSYPSEQYLGKLLPMDRQGIMPLSDMGFQPSTVKPPAFVLDQSVLTDYKENRDYPARDHGTTHISTRLRFGQLSVREAYRIGVEHDSEHFVSELIWREFFQHVLWYFPESKRKSIKPLYEKVQWSHNQEHFAAWCDGKTGYPIVDAGMRELNATGYMHNRVRMIVASFLCKHLQIDWRWGEQYFADKLFDYEMASNAGNWQWVAGSGTDTMPYFRIFNPYTQQEKFDPDWSYIKQWVPEYGTDKYPSVIVDHKEAREKTLNMYKQAVGK